VASTSPASSPGTLGVLVDQLSGRRFLADCGSVYSILPHSSSDPPTGPALVTANKTPVPCWGRRTCTVKFGGKTFEWSFLLAKVSFPIVGADFLRRFDLMVDLKRMTLVHGARGWKLGLVAPPQGSTFAALGIAPAPAPCVDSPGGQQVDYSCQRSVQAMDSMTAQTSSQPTPPPLTARSSPRQILPGSSQSTEFPTIRGAVDPSPAASSTPKFRAPGKHKQPRLPGNVKPLRTTGEKEGEYPSSAGSPGSHVKVTTPCPAPRATLPSPANPNLSSRPSRVEDSECRKLLDEFPAVLNPSKVLPPVKHHVRHHIVTEGHASAAQYRRLDPSKLEAAKKEFLELEKQGIVRRSSSHWASPLHMVKKPDGTWRPCGDFRLLNNATVPDRYTCPNLADVAAKLEGCEWFSKLDLRKGYHQVPVSEKDVHKTAVITPFGLFEFVRMPFGLRNSAQTFQRMMDEVLRGLPHVFVYIDDLLIASRTREEHLVHLREVLQRLEENGLVLNGEKCVLGVREVEYLGHVVSSGGIRPLPERVEAITCFPRPTTSKALQRYLGMLNFYRRFVRGAAGLLKPLTDALRGGNKTELKWTEEMTTAFESSKRALQRVLELAHPVAEAQLVLAVDASDTHVGAALQQRVGPHRALQPLGFFSKKLEKSQQKYSAFDRELLAVVLALRHFRWAVEGRRFTILTDHKPLTQAIFRLSDPWTARQQRHLAYVAEFSADLLHVAGADNVVADALSRYTAAAVVPVQGGKVSSEELAAAQRTCKETQEMRDRPDVQLVHVGGQELLCMGQTGALRPIVPVSLRQRVFWSLHGLAHAGVRATRRMLTSRYTWPKCASDVATWCSSCQGCAKSKPGNRVDAPVEPIEVPELRYSHVHVDLVGPLPQSAEGHTHLLTVIDRTTRWPEVLPIKGTTAQVVADGFVQVWVSRFGVPAVVTTDRGAQFLSSTWACLCRHLGMRHVKTTAYHPQANGLVERLHRQIKEALRARGSGDDWAEHLPWVLLGLRAAPKEEAGVSSAEVALGARLALPGPVLPPSVAAEPPPAVLPSTVRTYADVAAGPPPRLASAEQVMVAREKLTGRPLVPAYTGPFRVLERRAKVFRVQLPQKADWVSVDRLKAYVAPSEGESGSVEVPGEVESRGPPRARD